MACSLLYQQQDINTRTKKRKRKGSDSLNTSISSTFQNSPHSTETKRTTISKTFPKKDDTDLDQHSENSSCNNKGIKRHSKLTNETDEPGHVLKKRRCRKRILSKSLSSSNSEQEWNTSDSSLQLERAPSTSRRKTYQRKRPASKESSEDHESPSTKRINQTSYENIGPRRLHEYARNEFGTRALRYSPACYSQKIRIQGVAGSTDGYEIFKIFKDFGSINYMDIVTGKRQRGTKTVYLGFSNPREAEDAIIQMDGEQINGGIVNISRVAPGNTNDSRYRNSHNFYNSNVHRSGRNVTFNESQVGRKFEFFSPRRFQ